MMRVLFLLFLTVANTLFAQEFSDKNLQSLADAERAFSRMAKEKNTRDAFIAFLADDAVTAVPGQGPRIGKKYLEEQAPNEAWLYWQPVYSDIAASGDFGFNTGPWEFRQKRTDEKPVAFGEFVSIWKKNAQGEWKVAIDIGIGHGAPKNKPAPLSTSSIRLKSSASKTVAEKNEVFTVEKKFIEDFSQQENAAYGSLLSSEARFYRQGSEPYVSQNEIQQFLSAPSSKVSYTLMDGDIASSGDLAFVYGKAATEIVKDGATQTKIFSYMRFWKKEDGKNWKIILDLISN